ncbi:nuclear receptor subfamily 1 group I member 2 isoform X1 [Brienomyrus brachyistius]|uniref:nuclear receptor subfamily 1 group I member 2 isoform X1 n=1 Tax=Brienomyrus brachyistius TaxID=42636 RepID=UPI0020B1C28E|nr:nuclear receptor subfamily 1 group I member 2 isoform X1 [Brienomyrus brachyistius]
MSAQELRRPADQGPEEDVSANEDDEEPKVCQVCGDQATGYHFNALTCEGCKGFFRRAMKRPASFSCAFRGNCVITKSNRRQCQACRLKKCQSIGMLKELIMSDEELEQRRHMLKRKRAEPLALSPQQEGVIQELVQAQRSTFDVSFVHFKKFRPIDRNLAPMHEYGQTLLDPSPVFSSPQDGALFQFSSPSNWDERPGMTDGSNRVFITLPHIADLTTYMIQQIISFAKLISFFRELSIEDQISLLKGAMFEVCQIRFNMLFNDETGVWECGALTYCMDDAARAGFQRHLLDPLMKFHYTLRKLRLDDTEYVLMQAISLFSPGMPGPNPHKHTQTHIPVFISLWGPKKWSAHRQKNRFVSHHGGIWSLQCNVYLDHTHTDKSSIYQTHLHVDDFHSSTMLTCVSINRWNEQQDTHSPAFIPVML